MIPWNLPVALAVCVFGAVVIVLATREVIDYIRSAGLYLTRRDTWRRKRRNRNAL